MQNTQPTTEQKLKRAFWLAFKASRAIGYGILHSTEARQQTEDSLFTEYNGQSGRIDTDYVSGRMMKTTFEIVDDKVGVHPATPRPDYNSWAERYPTAEALLRAVDESFTA